METLKPADLQVLQLKRLKKLSDRYKVSNFTGNSLSMPE